MYAYSCPACGDFEALVPSSDRNDDQPCKTCGTASPRIIKAPRLSALSPTHRRAHETNERSQHSPSHSCCSGHQNSTAARTGSENGKSAPPRQPQAKRPWMLGH
ncbi:zinc ribbon domain-containing protein [Halovibrio salipaludis]